MFAFKLLAQLLTQIFNLQEFILVPVEEWQVAFLRRGVEEGWKKNLSENIVFDTRMRGRGDPDPQMSWPNFFLCLGCLS